MYVVAVLARPLGLRPVLVLSEVGLVLPGLLLLVAFAVSLRDGLALGPIGPRRLGLSVAAGASPWAASLGLLELQYMLWQPPPGYLDAFRALHEALRPTGPLDALVSVTAIALAPAVCEELLFRRIVLPSFLKPFGPAGAVAASAALFGLIHLDFTQPGAPVLYRVPFAFVVGIGLGTLRLLTASLPPAIAAHATLNIITLLATPLLDAPEAPMPDPKPLLGVSLLLAGGMLTALLFWKSRAPGRPPAGSGR
jgi:membrane protease YdiL (CAAX protease family)